MNPKNELFRNRLIMILIIIILALIPISFLFQTEFFKFFGKILFYGLLIFIFGTSIFFLL